MLAQKQPPFKECVIAHWSSGLAPKMKRGSSIAPKPWTCMINTIGRGAFSSGRSSTDKELWTGEK